MQAVSIYELKNLSLLNEVALVNKSKEEKVFLNDQNETFRKEMFVNERVGQYTRLSFAFDEEHKIRGRVFDRDITSIIVKNSYDGYFDHNRGTLIICANKSSADAISDFMISEFNFEYEKKLFDLETVMEEAADVKKTQFKDVRIETLSGSSLNGSRVHETELYDLLYNNGELSNVVVIYPINEREISFSISKKGSIVIFSQIENNEILTLIEDLWMQ